MASTNSTVSGTVTFETDDDLSETNIGAADAQGNRVDYVERGCGFSVNHTNDTITIGSTGTRANYVIVENPSSHVAWHLYPDQDTDIALPNASATNHVFIAYDESTDAISYHIDDDDTAPSEPSLKIGTVDTANDTSTETNRAPTIAAESASISGVGKGTTTTVIDALAADNSGGELIAQGTDGVSTSATVILDTAISQSGFWIVVQGDERGSTKRFMDVLTRLRSGDFTTAQHSEEANTPDGRTYGSSSNQLTLAMASGTYDVSAIAMVARRDTNATA